jgi:hypothetical protein
LFPALSSSPRAELQVARAEALRKMEPLASLQTGSSDDELRAFLLSENLPLAIKLLNSFYDSGLYLECALFGRFVFNPFYDQSYTSSFKDSNKVRFQDVFGRINSAYHQIDFESPKDDMDMIEEVVRKFKMIEKFPLPGEHKASLFDNYLKDIFAPRAATVGSAAPACSPEPLVGLWDYRAYS